MTIILKRRGVRMMAPEDCEVRNPQELREMRFYRISLGRMKPSVSHFSGADEGVRVSELQATERRSVAAVSRRLLSEELGQSKIGSSIIRATSPHFSGADEAVRAAFNCGREMPNLA